MAATKAAKRRLLTAWASMRKDGMVTRRAGPDWLTGGDFGLEASVVAMVVATIAGAVMLAFAVRRGKLIAPPWVRT